MLGFDAFTAWVRPVSPLLQVAEFLRRVLKLCAIRLADLLSRLDCHPADPQLLLAEVGRPWVGWC